MVAATTPLAPDEAYYWVWSRALAPGYLDHPPMVALWIWLGTAIAGDGALGVRLLGPLSGLAGAWLLVRAGGDLLGSRAQGLIAALLLNATLLLGIGAVTITPDTPLLFFWTLALFALGRVLRTGAPIWWALVGVAVGLALDSKYTAVLLPLAIFLWLVWVPDLRHWLRRPAPWIAAVIALAFFAPVLLWNAQHAWASFTKQGGRAGDWQPARAAQYLGELIGGQIGLATPILAILFTIGIGSAARQGWRQHPTASLLALLTLLPGLVFLEHALGDRVQANWPAIIYPAAALAAAAYAPRWYRSALGLGFGLTAIVYLQATATPIALPMRLDPTLLRLGGWSSLSANLEVSRQNANAAFIVSDNYGHAALLARLLPAPVLGLDDRWSLFALPDAHPVITGQTGILIRSARRDDAPDPRTWASITPIGSIDRARNGMVAESFRLYRVVGRDSAAPIVIMPPLR